MFWSNNSHLVWPTPAPDKVQPGSAGFPVAFRALNALRFSGASRRSAYATGWHFVALFVAEGKFVEWSSVQLSFFIRTNGVHPIFYRKSWLPSCPGIPACPCSYARLPVVDILPFWPTGNAKIGTTCIFWSGFDSLFFAERPQSGEPYVSYFCLLYNMSSCVLQGWWKRDIIFM